MLKNNIEVDVKIKLLEAGKTQQQLADEIGTTGQYVNRVMKNSDNLVNATFVKMMEALGYDIQLTYVPKEK
nr:MAG TPA: Helix-turn-helix XRE-family like protein [Caudoviricetes sp.]